MSDEPLERLVTAVPGPRSRRIAATLREFESRNVTYVADDFPIVWETAHGATVTDVDGNRYLDLTAAFGVANAGHGNPAVVAAVAEQAALLMHGMGDVHPNVARARLLEQLPSVLPAGLSKAFLATTGSEAVEAALKTAMLYTGKFRFAAHRGAYHGLSLGVLPLCGIDAFRAPFARALGMPAISLRYPGANDDARAAISDARDALRGESEIAALVVEPIAGRGGCIVPPKGYLPGLRALCTELGILLIVDEIFTGFGRTGSWFAVGEEGVTPDIICIGKALASGFPMSAAVGKPEVMDAWPPSTGEALHTSTYLGNPMGCAAALATIEEVRCRDLPARARRLGAALRPRLETLRAVRGVRDVRGRGLLWGIEFEGSAAAESVVKRALAMGVILLQSGASGNAITLAPPLVIGDSQLQRAVDLLEAAVRGLA